MKKLPIVSFNETDIALYSSDLLSVIFGKLSVDQQCRARSVNHLWDSTIKQSFPLAHNYSDCLSILHNQLENPDESLNRESFFTHKSGESAPIRFGVIVGLGKCGGFKAGSKIIAILQKVFPQTETPKDRPYSVEGLPFDQDYFSDMFNLYKAAGSCFRGRNEQKAFQELVADNGLYWEQVAKAFELDKRTFTTKDIEKLIKILDDEDLFDHCAVYAQGGLKMAVMDALKRICIPNDIKEKVIECFYHPF